MTTPTVEQLAQALTRLNQAMLERVAHIIRLAEIDDLIDRLDTTIAASQTTIPKDNQ